MMFGSRKNDDMQDKADQIANDAADSLRELGRTARGTADDVKKEAVKILNAAADTIRKEARNAGASHEVRGGADDVALGLERAAHYLKRNSFEDMGDDVASSVKRNPWRSIGMIFVVGLVIGMLLRGGDDEGVRSHNGYNRR
jgi:ElaB/YqjD/DUF883 family membrane-anchored ribosome-binding protein